MLAESVSHFFGTGSLRKQILFEIDLEVRPGEMVILMGPSGSGKTTLLTLVGSLRSLQQGRLRVLGNELRGASARQQRRLRRQIGYIFQAHNLLASLSALQNVRMPLALQGVAPLEANRCARELLAAVGLGAEVHRYPRQLSGGQKQRVAVARALAGAPRMLLADEPTASLDSASGREVVRLMRRLATEDGCAILMVTHDNRILDVADRILHIEDGRFGPLSGAVISATRQLQQAFTHTSLRGDLAGRLGELPPPEFVLLLEDLTREAQGFLTALEIGRDAAFEELLSHVLEAVTLKVGALLGAERASLFLLDEERGELWSKLAQSDGSRPLDIRVPANAGIVGRVVATGQPLNVADVYQEPLFNRAVDEASGYRTRSLLCQPLLDRAGRPFGAVQLLNKAGGGAFSGEDAARLLEFSASIALMLESWNALQARRAAVSSA